jgi:hypothetical protein
MTFLESRLFAQEWFICNFLSHYRANIMYNYYTNKVRLRALVKI